MAHDHLLVIDQGTTSTRAVVYTDRLKVVGQGQAEVLPYYPRSGWVEHDADALIASIGPQVEQAFAASGISADRIAAVGLTNQRETTVAWERSTGRPIGPALVWQDRRTADHCDRLRARESWISEKTGLVLDPYFSATKIAWMLDHIPNARSKAEQGELAAGTVDSFVVWHLTGGQRFVTDVTNASRTLLMDLRGGCWDDSLCETFGVPSQLLAEIRPSTASSAAPEGSTTCPTGCRSPESPAISRPR